MKRTLCFAGILLLCAVLLPISCALAVESAEVSVTLQNVVVGKPEQAEEFEIVVKALDALAPMPEGARDGVIRYTLKGSGSVSFAFASSACGEYEYEIYQNTGNMSGYSYDDARYLLRVRIIETGSGKLKSSVVIEKTDGGAKSTGAVFTNKYSGKTKADVPKTGDTRKTTLYALLALILLVCIAVVAILIEREKRRARAEHKRNRARSRKGAVKNEE